MIRILKFQASPESARLGGGIADNRGGSNHQNKSGAEAPLFLFDNLINGEMRNNMKSILNHKMKHLLLPRQVENLVNNLWIHKSIREAWYVSCLPPCGVESVSMLSDEINSPCELLFCLDDIHQFPREHDCADI